MAVAFLGWALPEGESCGWLKMPIRYVRLHGWLKHLDPKEVEAALSPKVEGCLGWDVSPLVEAVKQLPWVDQVRIERVWPDVLEVQIKEQVPAARWGERDLLNLRGEKFTPKEQLLEFASLPRIAGPEGHEKLLFAAYREMDKALGSLQLKLLNLEVDARRSWQLTVKSQVSGEEMVIVLGRTLPQAVFARVTAFLAALPAEKRHRILRLDARYEHGFAVRWRESAAGEANRHG